MKTLFVLSALYLGSLFPGSGLFAQTAVQVDQKTAESSSSGVAAPEPVAFRVGRGSMRSILEPKDDVYLSAQADGVVRAYPKNEGDRVKAGDVLVELDDRMEVAEVEQAKAVLIAAEAELEKAKKDFIRVDTLFKENIASDKQHLESIFLLAQAKSRELQAWANLDAAKVRLSYRSITSPIDGLYFKKTKSVGESIGRFETAARVIDDSELIMVVYAGAEYFGKVAPGDTVQVLLRDGPGKGQKVQAKVMYVDPLIDPATGTFRIKLQVEPSAVAIPGLSAEMLPDTLVKHG
ncbi:MAG TPA: efflux RND transporter periplasmic adaptor subunit [Opitutales bacterium]|nr:efflux RND transporter periplasmic adaptor subunit [Opitutales bacterium]